MTPRWHILYGLIFAFLFWLVFPLTAWYNISILFLASFLIDFDHYMCAVWNTKNWSLFKALEYHKILRQKEMKERKSGIFRKGYFHIFHTIEFHALVLAAGFVFSPFFYGFIGMLFHSLLDFMQLLATRALYSREFFLANWINEEIKTKFTKS